MQKIKEIYKQKCITPSDINQLLPIINRYAKGCSHITEMGVRQAVSTWAFLEAAPQKFICYDVSFHPNIAEAEKIAKSEGIDFTFKKESTLECVIENTDLLFIDTWHSYHQLFTELNRHHDKVNRYILMHDTADCEFRNENFVQEYENGLYPAIFNFTSMHKEWFIYEKFANNNGLTVLKRRDD